MNYERINWENAPSTDTPLDADNLNKMDEALDTLNREVAKTRSDVQEVEETAASLGSQIAGIIRLEDGSTTGDAELINGRVGKDGTTYQTIGDAIRGQIGDLRDHVIEVSDEEPEEFYNKIWVKDDDQEIEIPTKEELDDVAEQIGNLTELETTEKSNLVGAINEVLGGIPVVDDDLETAGAAADAKSTGDAITELNERLEDEGMSDNVKTALLACFRRVMWIDGDGNDAYTDLYNALYGEQPIIEPYYDFSKIDFEIGGLSTNAIYEWSGNTRSNTGKNGVYDNDSLNTRARMRNYMPAISGTITAMPGYEIVAYIFDSIQFTSNYFYQPKVNTQNFFMASGCLNSYSDTYPQWSTEYTIEDSNCRFIKLAFRKTDNSAWTQSEMLNMYGTVFTATLSPSYKFFEIADFKGGYSYTMGDNVKDELITEIGFQTSHIRTYVAEVAATARAVSGFLPITNGIFRSADTSKYQICLYQINFIGQIMWDHNNPYIADNNGNPAWADEFDLSISANKDDIFCVCISFKKLDGTEFTANELANMYGTVFTYEEA